MLLIKTYIDKSAIHGLGVFADQDIEEGETIWKQMNGFDLVFEEEFVGKLPEAAQAYIHIYTYGQGGKRIMPGDNDRYTNHADEPNTKVIGSGDVIALRRIVKGEEITTDYREFDEHWSDKLKFDEGELVADNIELGSGMLLQDTNEAQA